MKTFFCKKVDSQCPNQGGEDWIYTQTKKPSLSKSQFHRRIDGCEEIENQYLCIGTTRCGSSAKPVNFVSGTAGINVIIQEGSLVTTCKWKLIRGKWKCKK